MQQTQGTPGQAFMGFVILAVFCAFFFWFGSMHGVKETHKDAVRAGAGEFVIGNPENPNGIFQWKTPTNH